MFAFGEKVRCASAFVKTMARQESAIILSNWTQINADEKGSEGDSQFPYQR